MRKRKSITAEELIAELAQDPVYQARIAESQAVAAAQGLAAAEDEIGLVAELRTAGISVSSVYDFIGEQVAPAAAAPVLVHHLSVPHIRVVREGIIRALSCSHLRTFALEPLTEGFRMSTDYSERWLFANALAAMAPLAELTPHLDGISAFKGLFRRKPRK
jgi:hypothetical protein